MLTASAVTFTSCEDEDNEELLGNWVQTGSEISGTARGSAVCFQIGNVAYVGTGANTQKTEEKERFRDFYKCEVTGNDITVDELYYRRYGSVNVPIAWSARWDRTAIGVTSMPDAAPARNGAVAFSLNGKGYVGLGYDGIRYLKDFWEYDPEGTPNPADYPSLSDSIKALFSKTGSWRRIADYPGDSCRYAVAFVIDGNAYVGTGEDYDYNYLSDFYKLDGTTLKWTPIKSIGNSRSQATAFSYKGKGYVFGGVSSGPVDWFECYDPVTDKWDRLSRTGNHTDYEFDDDYGSLTTYGCTSFILENNGRPKAYVVGGSTSGSAGYSCWEYDITNDYWIQKTSLERNPRKFAVSYVLKFGDREVPFIATGCVGDISVTASGGTFYKDVELFNPYEYYEDKD